VNNALLIQSGVRDAYSSFSDNNGTAYFNGIRFINGDSGSYKMYLENGGRGGEEKEEEREEGERGEQREGIKYFVIEKWGKRRGKRRR
jgi:hypothetical protein